LNFMQILSGILNFFIGIGLYLEPVVTALPAFVRGAGITLELTVVGVFFGILLGLLLALGRLSKNTAINRLSRLYIWFFRGTPLLLQIFFIYYALPTILPFSFNDLTSAFIALSLNSAAYLAEIIRAAIQSIDKGQMEASKALGMSYGQAMTKIVIPQSYRRLIPPVGNEFIALLKDSSLVSIISLTELMRTSSTLANSTGNVVFYIPAAIFYLALTSLFSFVFNKLEKKYSVYE
jgi:polar amino acid transport system permease protein